MAAPCGLYIAKLLLPETEKPVTRGQVRVDVERTHANVVDAAAAGASDGMQLAINIAAMLIAFLTFIAFFDGVLQALRPGWTLARVFALAFSPVALLMGVATQDIGRVGDLLGGLGVMAPTRRSDLARLGGRALLGGFVATLINAAIAAILM